MAAVEHPVDTPSSKRRKYDHPEGGMMLNPAEIEVGWHLLQPILENEVLCAKIPTSGMAFDLLAKWFQIIVGDQEKLRVFRQWISSSSEDDCLVTKKITLPISLSEIKKDIDEPEEDDGISANASTSASNPSSTSAASSTSSSSSSSSTAKVTSIDFINNETPITPRTTPQVLLLQQLLKQQQQQIVLLQKLQNNPSDAASMAIVNTITMNPSSGNSGVTLTVTLKGGQWHAFSEKCSCICGFTTMDGTVTNAHRTPGGGEGEMCFVVPTIPLSAEASTPLVVHLTSCAAPHSPLVCANSFTYSRERTPSPTAAEAPKATAIAASSDDDSDGTPESSLCDEDGDDEDSGERGASPVSQSSPKQLMTIRERMIEHLSHHPQQNTKGKVEERAATPARVVVVQQPPTRVVWKNRRLDTPFKVRVECAGVAPEQKMSVLALVVDHKGKLQIDAMENFEEECSPQGITPFHNLRMTKGTWGKEWAISFVAVKGSTTNDPVIVGVSQACPVVVKTRKNPQIRHANNHRADSPSPVSFVERKPTTPIRLKRNRVEDLIDPPSAPPPSSSSSSSSSRPAGLHSEAMSTLLYAAEIKHQEREYHQVVRQPPLALPAPSSHTPSVSPPQPPPRAANIMLPSIQSGFGTPEPNFANLQGLLGFLEEIKHKHHPKLSIVEQPQLKREGNVLIVKKGKPFRTPFRLQLRTTPLAGQRADYAPPAPEYNPQQYVCVAVLRNDKGEEVALKNSEVAFDARGVATFAGLMVMKGTWGKTVQLTFEVRWGGARRIAGGNNWPPLRMLVMCETQALQLMCYTKDKKPPN